MTNIELYNLSDWYYRNVIQNQVIDTLNKVNATINTLLRNNGASEQHFINIFNTLSNKLSTIDYQSLSIDEENALKKSGLDNIILEPALISLSALLLGKDADIHTISSRLISMQTIINETDISYTNLRIILPKMFEITSPEESYVDKVFTRLTFHHDASINNVVNLSDWSNSWHKVARGYGMTLGDAPEDFEIISASKGSIIFDLLLNLETVNMLGETFNHIANFSLTMIEIKVALEGISYFKKADPEKYEELKKQLESDLDKKNEAMAEDIAEQLFDKFAIDKNNHEAKVNLKHGVKEVSKFINKGGDINFKTTDLEKEEQVSLVNEALLMLQNRSVEQKKIEDKSY